MSVTQMPAAPEGAEAEPKKSKKKLVIIVAVVLLAGVGGWWKFMGPGAGPKEEPAPVAGDVVVMDPIQINLESDHYLSVGIALQATDSVAHKVDGSKALDATIETFSGKPLVEVTEEKSRAKLKKHLEEELVHLYHGDVMGVYFTEFVTQ